MNPSRLFIGSLLLSIAYSFSPARHIDNTYFLQLPFEAMLYSFIVLFAFSVRSHKLWVLLPLSAACTNVALAFLWPIILGIPTGFALLLGLPNIAHKLFAFSFFSAVGAAAFCAILHFQLGSKLVPSGAFKSTILLTLLAGIPTFLDDPFFLPTHKAVWWLMFSLGLFLSIKKQGSVIANKTLQSPATQAGTALTRGP